MKYILILFLLLTFSSTCFAKEITQADLLQMADKSLIESNEHFISVCQKIKRNFGKDKEFIKYFDKDLETFKANKLTQVNMVLPHHPTAYGMSNYYVYSPMYEVMLNENKLEFYKQALQSYCGYNLYVLEKACEEKNIENIFK